MLDTKTLNSLDSMTKYKTYSRYNNILEKRFKGYSLKSLVKECKNPKQFIKVKFLEEFAKKHPYENEQYVDSSGINPKTRDFLNSFEKKKPKKIVVDSWARKSSFNKLFEPEPDPFRYNPNYNSIFKNVPCCRIVPPRVQLIKNINKNKRIKKLNLKNKIKSLNTSNNKTFDDLLIENKNKEKTRNINKNEIITKTLPSLRNHNYFYKSPFNKNNHAFKFSDYTPRKENILEVNNKISYIEPHDYSIFDKKKVMDFGKMQDRDKKSILVNYASLGVPSSSYYNPKYEYTDKKPVSILFTHDDIIKANKKSNKFKIHKLWTSYNVRLLYQLVDNDKLDNKI